jgi:hypothetical protein
LGAIVTAILVLFKMEHFEDKLEHNKDDEQNLTKQAK